MRHSAQCWILTIEHTDGQGAIGLLTVCGDGTGTAPESYASSGSLSVIFEELGLALDATMSTFRATAEREGVSGQLRLR